MEDSKEVPPDHNQLGARPKERLNLPESKTALNPLDGNATRPDMATKVPRVQQIELGVGVPHELLLVAHSKPAVAIRPTVFDPHDSGYQPSHDSPAVKILHNQPLGCRIVSRGAPN